MKADHESELKVQERLLLERAEEDKKRMKDNY
jgi:hypothetical protein